MNETPEHTLHGAHSVTKRMDLQEAKYKKPCFWPYWMSVYNWAAAWQNKQNDLCAHSDKSFRYGLNGKLLHADSEDWSDWVDQDQDQDSLLVKRRNDNHSPGPVIRELVPSSHQRSELSNTILCIFSRWDQRIGEGIPIPDSLGEEATFINICISNGSLKCHRVLISTTPSFGDKVICWYTGFTFKTFI